MTVDEAVGALKEAVELGLSATVEVVVQETGAPQVRLRISRADGLTHELTEMMGRRNLRVANSDVLLRD